MSAYTLAVEMEVTELGDAYKYAIGILFRGEKGRERAKECLSFDVATPHSRMPTADPSSLGRTDPMNLMISDSFIS